MAALALFGREIDESNIKSFAFPGNPQYTTREGQDLFYLVVNEKARVEIIKLVFGVSVVENPQIVLPGRTVPPLTPSSPEVMENSGEGEYPDHPEDLPSEQDILPEAGN